MKPALVTINPSDTGSWYCPPPTTAGKLFLTCGYAGAGLDVWGWQLDDPARIAKKPSERCFHFP